jgi:DnaJ homolog subfamily C member 28
MDWCQSIAERKIREAMEQGAFDNLPQSGKPILIDSNPFQDPSEWMASHLLRVNGFAPPWIEDSKEIRASVASFRSALKDAGIRLAHDHLGRRRAAQGFRERGAELNRRILTYNLKSPSTQFHMRPLDIEAEIAASSLHSRD